LGVVLLVDRVAAGSVASFAVPPAASVALTLSKADDRSSAVITMAMYKNGVRLGLFILIAPDLLVSLHQWSRLLVVPLSLLESR
jgi:hypothetical protein